MSVKNPQERRKEIMDTALKLFLKKGYEKTTVEDITNTMQVAKGSFYYYFKTKHEVFEACIYSIVDKIIDNYLIILNNKEKPVVERLVEYIEYNFELSEQGERTGMFEFIHSPNFEAIHSRVIEESRQRLMRTFTQLIKSGMEDCGFQTNDPEFTAAALLGSFTGLHELLSKRKGQSAEEQRKLIYQLMGKILGINIY